MKRAASILLASLALLLTRAPAAADEYPGIVCTATDGSRMVTFVAPTPDFTLEPGQSIQPQLRPDFRAEWGGFLKITRVGTYRLILTDGKKVLGQQTLKSDIGLMPVNLNFERKPGVAQQQLWWESDWFRPEPVPWYAFVQTNLAPEADPSRLVTRGRRALEDFNCAGCHRTDNALYRGRSGPDLSSVGSRVKKEWVYQWLADPKSFHTNALMPALALNDQERADMAAYLDTLRGPEPASLPPGKIDGQALYDRIGCANCHGAAASTLPGEGSKYQSAAALAAYLRNPPACDGSGRMPGMLLTEAEAGALAEYLMTLKNAAFEQAGPTGDAGRGKNIVQNSGCLNCHALQERGMKLPSAVAAAPLNGLNGTSGCLGNPPGGKAPNFHLTEEERAALAAFLASPDISPAPIQDAARWLGQFQCEVCHAWHGPPATPFGRDQEPPALSDAGNKLRRSWIEQVMTTTNRVRPWLHVRMPLYGGDNVAGFYDGFAEQAGAAPGQGAIIDNPRVDLADEGMHYIGTDEEGFSCITCHAFRGEPSHGDLHSPDLTTIDDRIRTDWLERWLSDPARITPGTAMPNFVAGKPDYEADKIVRRLLQALAMGPKMPDPPGWHGDPRAYIIEVSNRPVVQRCFLPDVSARAIAVGLPGGVSYAFDAENCQFRYAWSGGFLDAKPTWTWRGGLPPRVMGKKFYEAPFPGALRIGQTASAAPEFRGYEMVHDYPRFLYESGGAKVSVLTTLGAHELLCAYEVKGATEPVFFNGGAGVTVTSESSTKKQNDHSWLMAAGPDVRFTVHIPAP